jgi:hypothetical protein
MPYDFRKSLFVVDEVKEYLKNFDINEPEDKLGCVSSTR